MSVNQNIFDNNPSFLDSNKKVLFNINWDLNPSGVRQLELDALKCVNSNINNVVALASPIDGSTLAAKTTPSLFFARTRLIRLIDVWNRILNSGLFTTNTATDGTILTTYKIVGSNIRTILGDYLFRNMTGSFNASIDFDTVNIFNRLTRFLVAAANNHNWYLTNNVSKQSLFTLTTIGTTKEFASFINVNFNPTSVKFISLMNELLDILKELIDETKLATNLFCTFQDLNFNTPEGRTKILALDAYKSNYKALARIDLSYLNDETKVLAQEWIDTNSSKTSLLYLQFASVISRNTENETWNFRNVAIDTSDYNPLDLNPAMDPALKPYQTKYFVCTQLDMKRPLIFSTQFINWTNANDRPYIMSYNGGTLIYIPDEIKDPITPVQYLEQLNPDYTTISGYKAAPILPSNTYAMEFTFTTSSTTFPANNYGRKVFGLGSSSGTYTDGFSITVYSNGTYDVYWHAFGVATILYTDNYKNKTGKIRIENTPTGSEFYLDDVLKFSSTSQYQFTTTWGYGCSDANRYAPDVTISGLKYFYKFTDLSEQPDNQLNLSSYFWKIGTSNKLDPNYNDADIKLKLPDGKNLYDIDKIDFLDNLTIYLKIN